MQTIILITGGLSIWLTQCSHEKTRRWACIVGLAGNPFCLISTYNSGLWGMFLLTLFYSAAWLNGVWAFWVKPKAQQWRLRG